MDKKQVKLRTLNTLLWSLQILLTATFLWAGFIKLFTPAEQLSRMWPWTGEYPLLVSIAGLADTLAGIGMTIPRILRIRPAVTLYACYGIILLMVIAIIFHVSRGEVSQLGINFAITLTAIVVILIWNYLKKRHSGFH
ncbi:DoxX family protein [Dyadobacter sp. CY326]|uniref:DoxX family protein n=1 Tax=Dyadobacter sp. CY326 TaxID=2907300 RepID=UPI001F1D5C34|nr:DoxX family protein [Dyadobacter sp. CY326]MCE7067195.1 DoxX family protein [Dyadobacter sp. CY326]